MAAIVRILFPTIDHIKYSVILLTVWFLMYLSGNPKKKHALLLRAAFIHQHQKVTVDPAWSPGPWRALKSDSSSDDESSETKRDVLKVYNEAMYNIASLSEKGTVEPLTFRP